MDREELIRWSEPEQVLLLLDKSSEELKEMLGDEFAVMKDYAQNNPHHCYNLLEHTVRTAAGMDCSGLSDEDAVQLRVAALFHDIGKPVVALQKNGKTVFYNHGKESRKIAEKRLPESGIEGSELKKILFYIEHHDDFISFKLKENIKEDKNGKENPFIIPVTKENVEKKIHFVQKKCKEKGIYIPTVEDYKILMRLCYADAMAQSPKGIEKGVQIDSVEEKVKRLEAVERMIEMVLVGESKNG